MSPVPSTLITFAARAEADALIRRLHLTPTAAGLFSGQIDPAHSLHVFCHGLGRAAAGRLEPVLDRVRPGALIIGGVVGALVSKWKVADVVLPGTLIEASTGRRLSPTLPVGPFEGVLVTVSAVAADPQDKKQLRLAHDADWVDMESAALAALAERRGLRWVVVRAVSDTADHTLPADLAALVDETGRVRPLAAAKYVLLKPHRIGTMLRLGRDTAAAAEAMAVTMQQMLEDLCRDESKSAG